MAFTEASLTALTNPNADNEDIVIQRFIPGAVFTDVYAVGVHSLRGNAKWIQVDSTLTAAQANTAIRAALA